MNTACSTIGGAAEDLHIDADDDADELQKDTLEQADPFLA